MVDPNSLHSQLLTALQALPDVGARIYDAHVPSSVPEAGGYIRPYIVLFTGIGSDIEAERDLTRLTDTGVLDWSAQTTCVGANAAHARAVAQQARVALTNLRIGNGWLMPDPDSFRTAVPLQDNQVTPARLYVPLQWRLTTT